VTYYMGRYEESAALAAQGLDEARRLGSVKEIASASVILTFTATPDDDPAFIMARYDEIRDIAIASDDRLLLGRNLNNLAEWHRNRGDAAEAEAGYEAALAVHRTLDNPGMIAVVLCNYARLLIGQGQSARPREQLVASIAIADAAGLRGMDEHLLEVGAGLAALLGDAVAAARLHGASLSRLREAGAKRESSDEAFLVPLLGRARAAIGGAAFDDAERAGAALKRDAALAELSDWLGGRDAPPVT
jgi:hypothetical protein